MIGKNWPNHEIENYFVFIGKKIELKLFPNKLTIKKLRTLNHVKISIISIIQLINYKLLKCFF